MPRRCPEAEWKVFRRLREVALERFCKLILSEIDSVSRDSDYTCHDRYLAVARLLAKRNGEMARGFDDPRRSQMLAQLAAIVALDLVRPEELAKFTPATRETIEIFRESRSG